MATIRYFAGAHPNQKLFLSNGSCIRWTDVGRDVGVFATNVEFVQSELLKMVQEGKGGVTEITQEEYDKKKANRAPSGFAPFREEMSRYGYRIAPLANPNQENPGLTPVRLKSAGDVAVVNAVQSAPTVHNLQVPLPTDQQIAQAAVPVVRRRGPGRPRKNP